MGTVEVFTKARMQAIEDSTVVSGEVNLDGDLILETRDGTPINAGNVIGPEGPPGDTGPAGADGTALPDASTTVKGKIELATQAEVLAGIDGERAVVPSTLFGLNLHQGYRQAMPIIYTASGSFEKAAWVALGYTHAIVECQGAGGAGGGRTTTLLYATGGGAGGYARTIVPFTDMDASEAVTVGAGGTGVSGAAGNAGGASIFDTISGEVRGVGGSGGITFGSSDGAEYGGVGGGGTGTLVYNGEPGGMAIRSTGVFGVTGDGGRSQLGIGGRGRHNGNSGNGLAPAGGYGGGGGGAQGSSTGPGGAGANGIVIVTPIIGS